MTTTHPEPRDCSCCFGIQAALALCPTCIQIRDELEHLERTYQKTRTEIQRRHHTHHQDRTWEPPATSLAPNEDLDCDCATCNELTQVPAHKTWLTQNYPQLAPLAGLNNTGLTFYRDHQKDLEAMFPLITRLELTELLSP